MAKSRKNKRKASNKPVFYEAVPMFIVPATPLPELPAPPVIEPARIAGAARTILIRAGHSLRQIGRQLMATGLAITNRLIAAGTSARIATAYALDAAIHYGPSLGADIGRLSWRALRAASGKQARFLYLAAILCLGSAGVGAATKIGVATLNSYASDLSSPAALMAKKKTGTTILDRNGKVLFESYGASAAEHINLSDMPQTLRDATLAAEDPDFYNHPGVSWRATARAVWVDLTHMGRVEGGSTLTQQFVKNTLLTSDKKFERKFQEILLAIQLENHYSKDQILEMYLNQIYYGQGSAGVEEASQTYFHKSVRDLSLSESALLAGLPLGPSRFDPNFDLDAATGRRNYVLGRMLELGKITKDQADAAKAEIITYYPKTVRIQAPHFVFYVLDQLRALYGADVVEQGGLTVRTSLDLDKQHIAEQAISRQISALSSHHVTNGALISMEPASGDILAMVGSVDYNAPGFGSYNVTLADRQPGSSFKPIAYATAFKKGYTGATHVDDVPLSVPNGDGTNYEPLNYDLQFHGSVSLRHALGNSLNIPAVKVLQFAGIHDTIQTAHDLGVTGLQDESRLGLSLVLGGGEVRPIDMATVYATFANGGIRVDPHSILTVTDRHGKDITKTTGRPAAQVLDSRIAYMISSILSDDSARQPEFPARGPLTLAGRPVAAKTGTTNDFRDNWTVGYTPQLATAVWVGNNDNSKMNNVDGITGAAPIWHEYMERALANLPVASFVAPPGITIAGVCPQDGGLANPWDVSIPEPFMSNALPTKQCATFTPPDPGADGPEGSQQFPIWRFQQFPF